MTPIESKSASRVTAADGRSVATFLCEHPKAARVGLVVYAGDDLVEIRENVWGVGGSRSSERRHQNPEIQRRAGAEGQDLHPGLYRGGIGHSFSVRDSCDRINANAPAFQ